MICKSCSGISLHSDEAPAAHVVEAMHKMNVDECSLATSHNIARTIGYSFLGYSFELVI